MTKIGVLSDTHLPRPDKRFEDLVARHFSNVDMIIHAGDMTHTSVLDPFLLMEKEILAVCGNMDQADVQRNYPLSRTIRVEDVHIGIIHGWGAPDGIRSRIRNSFGAVDAIVYGHTHQAFSGMEAGVFFFNPGSPTDSRFTNACSVGIIKIDKHMIQGEIIPL